MSDIITRTVSKINKRYQKILQDKLKVWYTPTIGFELILYTAFLFILYSSNAEPIWYGAYITFIFIKAHFLYREEYRWRNHSEGNGSYLKGIIDREKLKSKEERQEQVKEEIEGDKNV